MSVLDDVVREASEVIPEPGEDNEEMQREAYRKMYVVEPLPAELEGKPYLSLFIKHNGVPNKHTYIATSDKLRDFIVEFWSDLRNVGDSVENYTIEYCDCDVPIRRIFSDPIQFVYYVCRHLHRIADCWKDEMMIDDNWEGIRKLKKEIRIIDEYENGIHRPRLFLDGKEVCDPSSNYQLEDVYENLLRKTSVGPYKISYNIGTCMIDECICETMKDVFDLILFELGFMLNSSWNEVIAHVRYGHKLPEEKGPIWLERLYRE